MTTHPSTIAITDLIDSLTEGVYVCDLERTITYWSKSAEQITGWTQDDVVGKRCCDNVLCHVDKDGHKLCGKEYCPLHRSMVTGTPSSGSLLVFAQAKRGGRVPMRVSVAPLRDDAGQVIGGVETFRDASDEVHDLERARAIQQLALSQELPDDPRVAFTTHYIPHDIIGGDFYAIERLDDDRYALMMADVMGHGIAAALYTMHLSQLWQRFHHTLIEPAKFAASVNNELVKVLKTDHSFATCLAALVDLREGVFRFAGAAAPKVLCSRTDGTCEFIGNPGLPLGVMADEAYDEVAIPIEGTDRLLLFSDGAIEIMDSNGAMLGADGFLGLLRTQGYPDKGISMHALEEALLKYSNAIRLPDDLTLIDIAFA